MERFFGESDDTLHKRRLPIEEASPACPCPSTPYLATHSCNSKHSPSLLPSPTSASSSLVHRLFNPAGWRVPLQSLRPNHSTMQQENTSSGQPKVLVARTKHCRPPLPPLYLFIRYHFLFTTNVTFSIEQIYNIYPRLRYFVHLIFHIKIKYICSHSLRIERLTEQRIYYLIIMSL